MNAWIEAPLLVINVLLFIVYANSQNNLLKYSCLILGSALLGWVYSRSSR